MADTYKGESLQKKCARWFTHDFVKRAGGRDRWEDGMHAFLASREGGDIGVMLALGVDPAQMLGFERDPAAHAECVKKWGVRMGAKSPTIAHTQDAGATLLAFLRGKNFSVKVAHVFWDFCSQIEAHTVDTCVATWRALPLGSFFSIAVIKGREKRQAPKMLACAQHPNREARRAMRKIVRTQDPIDSSAMDAAVWDTLAGRTPWDMFEMIGLIPEINRCDPATSRAALLAALLSRSEAGTAAILESLVEYQSVTVTGRGVPMLIATFRKEAAERASFSEILRTSITQEGAVEWRNAILAENDADRASLILNIPRGSAAALKAHVTRGTYAA